MGLIFVFVISGWHSNIESKTKLLLGEGGFEFRVLTNAAMEVFLVFKKKTDKPDPTVIISSLFMPGFPDPKTEKS